MQITEPIFNKSRREQILNDMRSALNSEFTWLKTVIHSIIQHTLIEHLLRGDTKLDTMDLGMNRTHKIFVLFLNLYYDGGDRN